ncbi:transmembrane and coiled-coil domains protein 2 isoform X1 [Anthonomus grandis grandis]|uniref:transmembrane and coiled-coil domains protein 2 isoform X1 n=1 Tax=Anthonomus grandis grandis TaxID=2921223 RepID=UPI002165D03F|nr:transmembrane and coiled-coil domains protein 2 isoform X1 [Anthonomus grandis grandis]
MQLTILSLWRLGAMDSLHVTSPQPAASSKTSSRSTSPARHKGNPEGNGSQEKPFHPQHVKTLSHGSADSAKYIFQSLQEGQTSTSHHSRPSRHKSPTQLTKSHAVDHPVMLSESNALLDDSTTFMANMSQDPDVSDLYPASFISNGSGEVKDEETDGGMMDPKVSAVLEQLGNKIVRVRDLIKTEQKLRDDNVNEYLRCAANADKQQVQRIKAVFEKKNQKCAQIIAQLQRKLDTYQKRVHDLEKGIHSHRPRREVLRDMGQGLKNVGGNIRDGITGFSGSVMSKPREFAHLIKNKFGSADNISQLSTWYVGPSANQTTGSEGSCADKQAAQQQKQRGGGADDDGSVETRDRRKGSGGGAKHGGSATLPMTASQSSMQGRTPGQRKFPSDDGSECESSVTSDSIGRYARTQDPIMRDTFVELDKKLKYFQEQLDGFREALDTVKSLQTDIQINTMAIQEERIHAERLEEQINDLTELHQNEVENLKQAMADMEEKVQYQSEERVRDIHEMLEHCQTKIQKMEHQALQQQQYVMLEGLDNSNARALVVKLINVLLTVLQVVLLLVATGAGIIMPFLRTRVRIITTVVFVVAIVFTLKQWPEVRDIGGHVVKRLKDTLDPVQ